MSGSRSCRCAERKEPLVVARDSNRPARLWRVWQRNCNHSAFNGRHYTPSKWSAVGCLRCNAHWRTKAPYVVALEDLGPGEINIGPGIAGYESFMENRGRTPATMLAEEV